VKAWLAMKQRDLIVIGGGIAGQAVVEAVRARDRDVPVRLICAEDALPYDRVALSTLLAGDGDPAGLALRPAEWYRDAGVAVELGVRVTALDPESGAVTLADGRSLGFSAAVICTGSDPLIPPLPGVGLAGVHAFRGLEDCAAIRSDAAGARHAAVIGGGLLGLEAARGVLAQRCPVTVVHLMDRLMERQLDAGSAAYLLAAMRQLGVEVMLERSTTALIGDDRVQAVRFADGEELACDLVVISIGIRPQVALARAAGLEVNRAVVVDDAMRSSAPNVLAVGECAEHRGVVHGLVAPIYEQAEVVAETLLSRSGAGYGGSTAAAQLKVMGVDLVAIGAPEGPSAALVEDVEAGTYRRLVVEDGRVTGAILLGDIRGHELLRERVLAGAETSDPLALLAEARAASAADLSDAAQVCNCNGVCKGAIVEAIRERGLASLGEVCAVTRAGTSCGSCKPLVSELLVSERGAISEEPAYLCPCRRQTREQLVGVVRADGVESVSELGDACGAGRDCGTCKPALAYLVDEACGGRHREERHARFINDRVHANIQKDGTFSVVPRIRGGVTSPAELRKIAEVAERYDVPMVKLTGGQRIDLLGVRKEQLPAIWEDLGMPSGHAYAKAIRTVKSCVGSDFCRFGLGDAIQTAIELERAMEGLYTPHKVKSSVSGCPRNCAESYVKDIGIVAVDGGWEVYVGGAAGMSVRKGDLLCRVETSTEALSAAITFLQHYRENAEYLERTYGYVERVGIAAIRAACLDEESDEPARLRERFRIARAAAQADPWLERRDPVHPRQFTDLDGEPVVVGPPAGGQD
jgi:nitrite reductase (NADH) large subunit